MQTAESQRYFSFAVAGFRFGLLCASLEVQVVRAILRYLKLARNVKTVCDSDV